MASQEVLLCSSLVILKDPHAICTVTIISPNWRVYQEPHIHPLLSSLLRLAASIWAFLHQVLCSEAISPLKVALVPESFKLFIY